jgi:hypothetical protein
MGNWYYEICQKLNHRPLGLQKSKLLSNPRVESSRHGATTDGLGYSYRVLAHTSEIVLRIDILLLVGFLPATNRIDQPFLKLLYDSRSYVLTGGRLGE